MIWRRPLSNTKTAEVFFSSGRPMEHTGKGNNIFFCAILSKFSFLWKVRKDQVNKNPLKRKFRNKFGRRWMHYLSSEMKHSKLFNSAFNKLLTSSLALISTLMSLFNSIMFILQNYLRHSITSLRYINWGVTFFGNQRILKVSSKLYENYN